MIVLPPPLLSVCRFINRCAHSESEIESEISDGGALDDAESAAAAGADVAAELDEDEHAEAEAAAYVLEAKRAAAAAAAAAAEQRHESLTQKRAVGRARQEAHSAAKRAKRVMAVET